MPRFLALVWPSLRADAAALDAAQLEEMLDRLDDLSPRVEQVDVGVVLVDVTGLGALHGDERRIAARAVALVRGVAPLPVRCGVGENRWLATLAARLAQPSRPDAPAAFRVLDRAELTKLPLSLLPADPATRQRFALFGLTVMGELAALPRSAVGAQFGSIGERLQALARGQDPRPLVPRRRPEQVTAQMSFEPPAEDVGGIALALRRCAADLCDRLRNRGLAPGRATLRLAFEDAPPLTVPLAFPEPALEPDWIARLLLSRVEAAARSRVLPDTTPSGDKQVPGLGSAPDRRPNMGKSMPPTALSTAGRPPVPLITTHSGKRQEAGSDGGEEPRITGIGLTFDRLATPAGRQLAALDPQVGRWEELRWSLERMRARFGEGRLWRAEVPRPSASLPERRARVVDIGP
jgi:nucleotidyltransferase/DNA polymerase involved in DNA repair